MARVLLIQAAVHHRHVERAQPLGLMSVAAHVRAERGDDLRLYDMRLDWKNFAKPLSLFDSFAPDVVGIGAHGVDAPAMHELARRIKDKSPDTPVIGGGVHATMYWKEVLEDEAIDCVAIGEGEHTFKELLDQYANGRDLGAVNGIAYRENGGIVRTDDRPFETDLDRFPFPAWDLIDVPAYGHFQRIGLIYKHPQYITVETARGCPFHCAWCHRSMGGVYRPHSPEYVISMFETLYEKHGIRDFMIIDDLFNLDGERVERVFDEIVRKGWNIGITIPIGFRADVVSDQTLEKMARAGVYRVMVAIETATPRLQEMMGKRLKLDRTKEVIRKARELGISVHGNLIIGLPTETEDEMWSSVRYARESKLDTFGIYRAIPFRGTRLHQMAKDAGLNVPDGENFFSFCESDLNLSRVPMNRINWISRLAIPAFYFKPSRIFRLLFGLPHSFRQFPYLVWFFFKKLVSW